MTTTSGVGRDSVRWFLGDLPPTEVSKTLRPKLILMQETGGHNGKSGSSGVLEQQLFAVSVTSCDLAVRPLKFWFFAGNKSKCPVFINNGQASGEKSAYQFHKYKIFGVINATIAISWVFSSNTSVLHGARIRAFLPRIRG